MVCQWFPKLCLLALLLRCSSTLPDVWAAEVTVASLLAAPDRHDRQEVTLTSTAQTVKPTTSRRGNPYATVQLADTSGKAITVFSWGHRDLNNGDQVEVTGIFQRVKRVGQYVFYKEIEAKETKVVGR
jgi:DNA polymerase III alpha subunit